jgi:glutathione S-transferase
MILIGQYDSSFVRRIGIALKLYEIRFEHRPWSTFGDAEKIKAYNPLIRVPSLVLDDGGVLVDSFSIIDHLDSMMPAERRMFPIDGPARRQALRIAGLATGLADKGVALFYETRFHENNVSETWAARCRAQILGTLGVLDQDRGQRTGSFWFGDRIGHADIAVACALRHVSDSHPGLIAFDRLPALAAHCERLEAMPVFQEIQQPFIPPS